MTLDVFPDPRAAVSALLTTAKAARWSTAVISTKLPDDSLATPHIQHAWDGTTSEQANRQIVTIRVTIWTPKSPTVQVAEGIALAQLVRAYLKQAGSSSIWRFRVGPGPIPGIDPATKLPFCTFSLSAETRPTRVA